MDFQVEIVDVAEIEVLEKELDRLKHLEEYLTHNEDFKTQEDGKLDLTDQLDNYIDSINDDRILGNNHSVFDDEKKEVDVMLEAGRIRLEPEDEKKVTTVYVETSEDIQKMCFHCKSDFDWDQLINHKNYCLEPEKEKIQKLRAVLEIKKRLLTMRYKLQLKVSQLN
eukprot:TRINITY_DN1269_c0_g1_i6.p1 TRINITY_DN1269_c0_g1~~TRINITY_DN1269_c0_g1_i6.p1  ORF type:complete len:167 (-),score=65.51 TRINITY_DN1269_c0_g1_i6:130-630(-)